ncbi:probably inactive leucine-rich repeat receptor-like protein kinase At5g48380 [Jatropha curcas]|uniref:probably inactive leucine-rich repeat receptor-like protein kinase At5g48380 n=1 Tax=Jatropha curcas TaxID=180498 RepID=UPI001893B339|nr:probably inactive leucine-rich repeat receptor-like protein kinase At5g48380 [Jatropha curcas]
MGLEGNFPTGIENCTTLTGLNLSGSQISGTIPSDISKRIPFLSVLDLSHNNLSGEIPVSIANCSFLNVLILDNNRLTGQIPTEIGLLSRLRRFSVANNLLSGPVPNFNPNFTAWVGSDGYANNEGLCGVPLDPCLPPPIEFPVRFFHGFVVGYAVAFALVIVLFALYSTTKFSKNKVLGKKIKKPIKIPIDGRRIDIKISTLERMVTRMSCKEIAEVTSNFDKENIIGQGIIGQGKMGTMYKATLPNGWFLAIKRLYNFQNFKKEFVCELMTLGRLRHTNLVPLIGFCIEKKEMLLIYKYISNGTLYDWLHKTKIGGDNNIDWPLRVKIAIGLARGLAWLHYNPNIQVIHLNITSKCILLDQKFEPKMSNFNGALFLNRNDIQSTRDFIVHREFWEMGFVKKDVHSFGMLLVELITGKDPTGIINSFSIFNGTELSISSSGLYDAIDKRIVGQGNDGEIFQILRIACDCVQAFPEKRPTMLKVYRTLRAIGERYGPEDDSDMLSQTEISMFKLGLK